ncbi:TAXI family TRAP transporter solute-binding subunit [Almyronema epifaneia]|uniref:TAXI family TRAP transporter solute-binding subunit n=1 Tax=Almyronema epifaneia S1 TaxID=2991925 RepID=A0ABW6IJV5_9CYAN
MTSRWLLPVVAIGAMGAIAFAALTWREQQRVYHLVLATGGEGGQYFAFGQAFAQLVAQHHPDIQIEVQATQGSPQNMDWLQAERVQLALVQNDTPALPAARGVAKLFPEMFHFVVAKNAGIESIADLRGKRVALMPEGSGSYALFWPLSQHYGLTPNDFQAKSYSPTAAHEALLQGEADALFRVIGLGNGTVAALLQSDRVRLLPIDQVEALRLSLPYVEATQIPKGSYDGGLPIPATDLEVVAVNALLVAHANVDDDVVRRLTQTLHEFRNELIQLYPAAVMIEPVEELPNLGLPLHNGAQAYYGQDQPYFLVEYAEPIGLLISVSLLIASGVWQFRLWLIGRQKNRADMYNLEILDLINRVQETHTLADLKVIRQQLFKILQEVVVDLDIDRISPESFQSFTFPWEVAINTIRHQEVLLSQSQSCPPSTEDNPDA